MKMVNKNGFKFIPVSSKLKAEKALAFGYLTHAVTVHKHPGYWIIIKVLTSFK